ncbi:MAG: right-handed parallel beta-helix repeat-containing protein, partial [Armatimonadota bacterium]|nr:right-handed parallel beta-helix repeat-containing protein [Armatimonadota bacterium]
MTKYTNSTARLLLLALLAANASLAGPAAEAPQTVLSADFEGAAVDSIVAPDHLSSVALTTDPKEVVAGKQSLKGDSRASTTEWNEFFHSRTGFFRAKEAYRVSFDYKVLARDADARFYALFRRSGGGAGNDGWTEWQGAAGTTGHTDMSYTTRNQSDFILIIGIRNRGALAIDNLRIQTDPANHPVDVRLPEPHHTWKSPGKAKYFVDSVNGADANDGKSEKQPWRSLTHVNEGEFGPGDQILLKAGSHWQDSLAPAGSGIEGSPVRLTRYRAGPKPALDAGEKYLATLYLSNVEYWEVSDLDIANRGKVRQPGLTGVQVSAYDYGVAHHIQLKNLDIHDVTGSLVKDAGGGNGINCSNGGSKVKSRFDGLLIEGCHLQRTDRNGITMNGNWSRADWYPSLHVVIRGNRLEDIGGDGIVPIGCDGALIERNTLHGGRMRCDDYAAGIWPWSCDNTTIQFNEVSGMKGDKDGEGYDSDWNCRNTLFQYNYSHNNDGGFMLICNDGSSKPPWNAGNTGTVIRYNISQNDGLHTFNISGPCRDTLIYNNTFY